MKQIINYQKIIPKGVSIREAVIPLKRHLVKFISVNSDEFIYSSKGYLWELRITSSLNLFEFFFNELFTEIYEISIIHYTNRRKLNPDLQYFVDRDYLLIKFKFLVSIKPYKKFSKYTLFYFTKILNDKLENDFISSIRLFDGKTVDSKITNMFSVFRIDETEIKKSTLKRMYYRSSTNKEKFDKKRYNKYSSLYKQKPDRIILAYYTRFLSGEITLNEIAKELNISKSTVQDIFSNPNIQKML